MTGIEVAIGMSGFQETQQELSSAVVPGYKDVVARQKRMLEIATGQIMDLMGIVPDYVKYNDERGEYLALVKEVEEIEKSL